MPVQHYEKGTYRGVVTAQRFGETPTGSPYFAIEFEPKEATGANDFPDIVFKREVTLYMTEKAAPYSIANLRRIGWEGSSFAALDPTREDFDSLAGTEIDVVCDYNDKGYEDWNLAGPNNAPKESDKTLPGKLDKLFGKALKSSASKATPAKAKKTETVPPDIEDDEIPF